MNDSATSGGESGPGQHAVLSNYPIYVSAPRQQAEKTYSPIVTSGAAYAASFVAQLVVAFFLGFWVVDHGISTIMAGGDLHRAAAQAALVVIAATTAVGVLAAWVLLRLRKVRAALLVAFLGQVAELVVAGLAGRVADAAGWVLGALAAIGTTYWLITWRRMRDSNPRGR